MRISHDLPVRALRALTDEQEHAVASRDGSLLLAAGAGSGKTSVLVERFVRAVREDGVAPGRILAITFTERAAGELRERVRASLLEHGERDAAREAEAAHVCTFHGFCARLLRAHPLQAGVEPGFEILEENFAARLRTLAFSDALASFVDGERAEAVDLVAAYGADPLRKMVLGAYAQLRSQGQSEPRLPVAHPAALAVGELPEAVAQQQADVRRDEQAVRSCTLIGELLERFDTAYAQRKHARAALDFDDLELDARELLERRLDVREAWAERFQLLMVDEFQDSNPRQLEILAALDRDNLFTVGDQLQSIYSFRHADVGLFRERHARLSERGASLALTRNFRSRPAILAAVERIFAKRMGERFTALAAVRAEVDSGSERCAQESDAVIDVSLVGHAEPLVGHAEPIVELLLTDKRGWKSASGGGTPFDCGELDDLPDATPWRQAEARLLAARVAELVASGQVRAGEIVLLLRSLGDLPVYEAALRAHDLPTLAGVGGFWGHQQVGDLLAWLRALANPLDELALYSALASPLVGVSSDGLALIASGARTQRGGVWQAIERAFAERTVEREEPNGGPAARELAKDAIDLRDALPEADRKRLGAFCELFAAERATIAMHPIAELLRRVVAATGYDSHVLSLDWGERRLANVHKLVSVARRFEAGEGRDLRGFLDHVAHAEVGREADAPVGEGELDAVRLMSIHAAKGLEFPVVCVADLGREPNLRVPDLLVDGVGGRVGLRLLSLADPEPRSALDYDELREARRAAQEEEEDRVLYVACTRAENRLLLSGAVAFERWPEPKPAVAPIAWLAPALVGDAPKLAASEQRPAGGLTIDAADGLLVRCVFNAAPAEEDACPNRAREPLEKAGGQAASVVASRGSSSAPIEAVSASVGAASAGGLWSEEDWRGLVPRSVGPEPQPMSDPDATMSYTSLTELERCGYRYYLERVLRLPENHAAARLGRPGGEEGGIDARVRGRIVHVLLEPIDWARPQAPSERDVALVAKRIGAKVGLAEREEIAALIGGALESTPARELRAMGPARSEHPFSFSLGAEEPLVTGVLDLVVERPDGTSTIVDYKSDRLLGGEDLERLVLRDYGFQRLLYALAAIENGAHEVEVAHWFLERPGEWVSARFVSEQQDRLREQLLGRIAQARARGFAVTDAPHRGICLTCPGRGGLCSWGETRTMSARSATLESGEIGGSLNV
jgi:ATP-dependent helicase/nuclease subunit A